jgi:hypothetical protein
LRAIFQVGEPPKKKKKMTKKKPEPKKTDEETDVTAYKEVKEWFANFREKIKQEELGAKNNEGRKERLKDFIYEKEARRRRKLPLKTDFERSVDKSYAKKRQRGSSNSCIEQIPASTSVTATDKNKEIHASTSGTAKNKNKEVPGSTSRTTTNIEQISASMTYRTNLFVGISAEVQKPIDIMFEEELARLISFYEQTRMPLGGILGLEDLPLDKNQEFRWLFEVGQPLVKPKLVNKLPTKMHNFHGWYLKKSAEGLEMFGMLVRPGDSTLQKEKVLWLQFIDIYEIYHLDAMNTDLMMAWCL